MVSGRRKRRTLRIGECHFKDWVSWWPKKPKNIRRVAIISNPKSWRLCARLHRYAKRLCLATCTGLREALRAGLGVRFSFLLRASWRDLFFPASWREKFFT
jgi:hypothetical protein